MEARIYRLLEKLLLQLHHPRRKKCRFTDQHILLVLFWAVLHDRPVYWACAQENWPDKLRRELPDQSTMSRRLRKLSLLQLFECFLAMLDEFFEHTLLKAIDSKPLAVGNYSKDRDADRGYAAGLKMRGYKVHAIAAPGHILHWTIAPMSEHDSKVALRLLPQLARRGDYGYLAGDNAYDSNQLHTEAAAANHQLVAPPRAVNAGKRDAKHNTPQRMRSLDLCEDPLACCGRTESFGGDLTLARALIERDFGRLTMLGIDLPPSVRGPRRVVLWVAAKLAIDCVRQVRNKGLMR